MELDELRKLQKEVQGGRAGHQGIGRIRGARACEAGVRDVEAQLNAAREPRRPPAPPAPLPNCAEREPGRAADAAPTPPRQAALPGFDKI